MPAAFRRTHRQADMAPIQPLIWRTHRQADMAPIQPLIFDGGKCGYLRAYKATASIQDDKARHHG